MSMDEVQSMVESIYSNIGQTVEERCEKLEIEDYINMYGRAKDGSPIYDTKQYPNDLYFISRIGDEYCTPPTFFGDIGEFATENNVHFKSVVSKPHYNSEPEMTKNEDSPKFAYVSVQKTWIVNGKSYRIDDEVQISLEYRCIASISSNYAPLEKLPEVTEDDMMAKAARLYGKAQYNEAAALYAKIVSQYPNNDDAWYSLGVMYFKMQGVGKLSNKQRLQKAYDCWKHSNLKKARRAISYITDGRE